MKYVPPKKVNTEEVEEIIDDIWNTSAKRPNTNGSLSNPQNEN
jgi:hypothetical protein